MIFGYMRISTQKATLEKYAKDNSFKFDEVIEERISGSIKTSNRPKYNELKSKLRQDDILVITDLDRLGRNADDVIMELKQLKLQCVKVVALDMPYMCDWNKANDNSIYDMVIDKLKVGGLLISDNILYKGMVAHDDFVIRRKKTIVKRMRNYLDYICNCDYLSTSLIPIGDGVALSYKNNKRGDINE